VRAIGGKRENNIYLGNAQDVSLDSRFIEFLCFVKKENRSNIITRGRCRHVEIEADKSPSM
jgi:hypothetical protein